MKERRNILKYSKILTHHTYSIDFLGFLHLIPGIAFLLFQNMALYFCISQQLNWKVFH